MIKIKYKLKLKLNKNNKIKIKIVNRNVMCHNKKHGLTWNIHFNRNGACLYKTYYHIAKMLLWYFYVVARVFCSWFSDILISSDAKTARSNA